MHRIGLLPLALLCLAAAPTPTAAVRPAPKAVPTKAPAAKPAPAPSAFDAQNPQGLIDLLSQAGAKAQIARRDGDTVFVTATSKAAAFSLQFVGCTPQGRSCKAVLLDHTLDRGAVSLAQLNQFNQTSVMCRLYQDRSSLHHVVYSAVLFKSDTAADAAVQLQAWQGCIADGREFLKDPVAYLANAA